MRACKPKAAPPEARAIVTSKTIVRPVSIIFTPPDVDGAEHITPRFSFGFRLTVDIPTAQYLNENPTSGNVPVSWSMLPFQDDGSLQCWMVGLIIGALVLVLGILMAYQRYVAGKKPVQHLCDYCGHMVTAVSDCHHAPVRERFLHGTCLECKQDCRLVCARCKNPL